MRVTKIRPIRYGARQADPNWPDTDPGPSEFEKVRREVFNEE